MSRGTLLDRVRRWLFLRYLALRQLTGFHILGGIAIFMVLTVLFTMSADHPEAGWMSSILRSEVLQVHDVPDLDPLYDPVKEVAWAIPVGGRCWHTGAFPLAHCVSVSV